LRDCRRRRVVDELRRAVFLSLLTASIASRFVREERTEERDEMMEALRRIEADLAELKSRTGVG
jgi:hypothetical protein